MNIRPQFFFWLREINDMTTKGNGNCTIRSLGKKSLEEVIAKINEQFAGQFDEGDRVVATILHEKLKDNKKLQKAARNNGKQMFMNNVFPGVFNEAAQDAYIESTETFTRMFQESERYNAFMNAMASVLFHEFQE